ncbi:hypothetical protein GHK86_10325 [Acidimicrobiaceae bacterium USS-CC1]|uniref:Uncharacterized protein n=1 Tax=Acidiferrimicrobium australe TaxID=2664430 RepID=A0ABW9QTU9_9ACTN|nr:hypothetical protein [Acidiferrimicrobium australe]
MTMGRISGSFYGIGADVARTKVGRPVFLGSVQGTRVSLQRPSRSNRAIVPRLVGRLEPLPEGGTMLTGRMRFGLLPVVLFAVIVSAMLATQLPSLLAGVGWGAGMLLVLLVLREFVSWGPDRSYLNDALASQADLVPYDDDAEVPTSG